MDGDYDPPLEINHPVRSLAIPQRIDRAKPTAKIILDHGFVFLRYDGMPTESKSLKKVQIRNWDNLGHPT